MTPKTRYTELLHQVCNLYGLPFDLLEAQVLVESDGDPDALRYEHAYFTKYVRGNAKAKAARFGAFAACSVGLLQVLVETAYEDGFDGRPEQLFTPIVGLAWGAKHLKACLTWADGDMERALACYNGGPKGNVTRPLRNQAYATHVYTTAGRPLP